MAEYDYQMSFPRRRDNGPECLNTISSEKQDWVKPWSEITFQARELYTNENFLGIGSETISYHF
ncbi:hypothetical protein CHS0354_026662 [Potamilus streckersoni]|uniref:Uncharacterized protein n=1 Tax=Potamilus streckersoni TaxID=2493646 RepID=A0AAE0VR63_9BIVA|nr:hypothetical protein CHS0354_026662 [Potamilus streckersoni]